MSINSLNHNSEQPRQETILSRSLRSLAADPAAYYCHKTALRRFQEGHLTKENKNEYEEACTAEYTLFFKCISDAP